jgi:hypothetical protein
MRCPDLAPATLQIPDGEAFFPLPLHDPVIAPDMALASFGSVLSESRAPSTLSTAPRPFTQLMLMDASSFLQLAGAHAHKGQFLDFPPF